MSTIVRILRNTIQGQPKLLNISRPTGRRNTMRMGFILVGTGGSLLLLEYMTHIPTKQFRSTLFYHTITDQIVTPILRTYYSPETAYNIALYCIHHHLSPLYHPNATEQRCTVQMTIDFPKHPPPSNPNPTTTSTVSDSTQVVPRIRPFTVPHVLGLAAGFDIDGSLIPEMIGLGFGHVEIGTVAAVGTTSSVQQHSSSSSVIQGGTTSSTAMKMLRLPYDFAIIYRNGFPSLGFDIVKENIIRYRTTGGIGSQQNTTMITTEEEINNHDETIPSIPTMTASNIVLLARNLLLTLGGSESTKGNGIIGINLDVHDTPTLIQELGPYADYLVIHTNSTSTTTSSTTGQTDKLLHYLSSCVRARNSLMENDSNKDGVPPLFVKLSPDITDDEVIQIAKLCQGIGIDGFIVANTTHQRPADLIQHHLAVTEHGGLSGRPLRDRSTAIIRLLYRTTNGRIPIIGVGGISSGHDIYEKLRAGASLVQLYSHMVYHGPGSISTLRKELAELLLLHGHRNVSDVVGLDHEDIVWDKRHEQLALREMTEQHLYPDASTNVKNDNNIIMPQNDKHN